jgi:hypothetical protein
MDKIPEIAFRCQKHFVQQYDCSRADENALQLPWTTPALVMEATGQLSRQI